jgi:dTDP-glucose 4,6-dehydratase
MSDTILVTGGAGFIGSNFVLEWMRHEGSPVINLDKLTYAGNLRNLQALRNDRRHTFVLGDIGDRAILSQILSLYEPRAVVHFAAESHVDRSILGPGEFIRTNVEGTFRLLDETKNWWLTLDQPEKRAFRILHVSTDEVYGSLGPEDDPFVELSPYAPNSPYSASKAAADHLVRAYHHTYGLPTLTTNCSNNYGPYQFPEKLIPLIIMNGLRSEPLPIYGDGQNVRDWLYVRDHCAAIRTVLKKGTPGETYNIGGGNERNNLDVVHSICELLDEFRPARMPHKELIEFVKDRPGHDRRYAIGANKIKEELGWEASETFESGLRKTVEWYLDHEAWVQEIRSGAYQQWVALNYEHRETSCEA